MMKGIQVVVREVGERKKRGSSVKPSEKKKKKNLGSPVVYDRGIIGMGEA